MVNSAHIADFGICFQAQGMAGTGGGRLFAALREQHAVCADVDCFGLDGASVKMHPEGAEVQRQGSFWRFCELRIGVEK